ncbi:MAG: hypothetical protein SF069_00045 [Phycisphaerae bacterium]|nr:hypothetical protein [Phycisphaerae bacterium]
MDKPLDMTSQCEPFQPSGICPHCGYETDPGVCAECGAQNERVHSRSKGERWRRFRRLAMRATLAFAGLAVAVSGGLAAAYAWLPESALTAIYNSRPPAIIARFVWNAIEHRIQLRDDFAVAISQRAVAPDYTRPVVTPTPWQGEFRHAYDSDAKIWISSDGWCAYRLYGGGCMGPFTRCDEFGPITVVSAGRIDVDLTDVYSGSKRRRSYARVTADGRQAVVEFAELPVVLNAPQTEIVPSLSLMPSGTEPLIPFGSTVKWPAIEITDDLSKYRISPPLIGRVLEFGFSVLEVSMEWRDPPKRRWQIRARLNVGESAGVYEGLPFWANHSDFLRSADGDPAVRVTEVFTDSCMVEGKVAPAPWAKEPEPFVGMEFLTGREEPAPLTP